MNPHYGTDPDPCGYCGHRWHGLPCTTNVHDSTQIPTVSRPCNCPGPFTIEHQDTP